MSDHVVRRGGPLPRTFEQRPTTKLDSDQLRQLLTSPEPVSHAELEAEIEIVTPMLDDILHAPSAPIALGSLVEIAVPVRVDEPMVHVTHWPNVVFALVATAWIAAAIAGF